MTVEHRDTRPRGSHGGNGDVMAGSEAGQGGQPGLLGAESGPQGLQKQSGLPKTQVPPLSPTDMEKTMLGYGLPRRDDRDKGPEHVEVLQTPARLGVRLTSVALGGDGALWVMRQPGWSCGLPGGLAAHKATGPVGPWELGGEASWGEQVWLQRSASPHPCVPGGS